MPKNHLKNESSRYLQQHATNPVDWYPWSTEVLEKARQENKPILLSIGYSACHWCHVMEAESFVDEETATLMNELFINIKVDREERPDLDKVFQMAHQLLTGHGGGWPLTLFLTHHDQTPFFAGTYFPKRAGLGTPSFKEILRRIADLYHDQLMNIVEQNERLKNAFKQISEYKADVKATLNSQPLLQALKEAASTYDQEHGGFSAAPKFPHPTLLEYLHRNWIISKQHKNEDKVTLAMLQTTLEHMAKGGIYDQLGGGFFRYSVDDAWQIPHFEKMLYDNGQLLTVYAQAITINQDPLFIQKTREIADWVVKEMTAPEGCFYSTLDADSEHIEGKFYYWDLEQIKKLLTKEEYKIASLYFGLDQSANFEQHWHLIAHKDVATIATELNSDVEKITNSLEKIKKKLLIERSKRIYPGRDEKILTGWNALMIKGLALAGNYLNDQQYIAAASKALDFILQNLWKNERLYANYQAGQINTMGFLDDYAFLLDAILILLQIKWETRYLQFAIKLADQLLQYFYDEQNHGFFFVAKDQENVLYNPKPLMDEAVPAGNGVAVFALQRLGHLLGEAKYLAAAEKTLQFAWSSLTHYSSVHCTLLNSLEEFLQPPEIVILRGKTDELKKWQDTVSKKYVPNRLVFAIPEQENKLPGVLNEQKAAKGKIMAYICKGHECKAPIENFEEFVNYFGEKI